MKTIKTTKQLGYCNEITVTQVFRKNKPTRIEVDSELYNLDTTYQDVTLDTAYSEWQKEQLTKLFKND